MYGVIFHNKLRLVLKTYEDLTGHGC